MKNSYLYKTRFFIIAAAVIMQTFLLLTISASYMKSKKTTFLDSESGCRRYMQNELDTLSLKFDNFFYELNSSGAMELCSKSYVLEPPEKAAKIYSDFKRNMGESVYSSRYISEFYLIGINPNQYSVFKSGNTFSELGEFNLDYSEFISYSRNNGFTKNYNRVFLFDSNEFAGIIAPDNPQYSAYNRLINSLDGKIVYFSVRNEIFCIVVFNNAFFDEVFGSSALGGTDAVIYGSSGNVIYKTRGADVQTIRSARKTGSCFTYKTDLFTLAARSDMRFTYYDLLFMLFIVLVYVGVILWAIFMSRIYADKITEPYRILKGFFSLNTADEPNSFDYINFTQSSTPRVDISKNICKALVVTLLVPSFAATSIHLICLNTLSSRFIKERIGVTHEQLVQQITDKFDFYSGGYISSEPSTDTEESRLKYTVKLNRDMRILEHPFERLEYMTSAGSNMQSSLNKSRLIPGTLINIERDLFGDHALGYVTEDKNGTYTLNVFKAEHINSVTCDESTDFIILDSAGNTVTQSTYIDDAEKRDILSGSKDFVINTHTFDDYGWTLYSFSRLSRLKSDISYTTALDISLILVFLLFVFLYAWVYSTRFLTPLDRIKNAMKSNELNTPDSFDTSDASNEIEDVLAVYNQMVTHIKTVTDEKIQLVKEDEQIKLLKLRAEINALQHQINPHFLYNTLEMINLKLLKYGDIETCDAINKLAKIFRYAVSSADETVFMYEEITNTENYLTVCDMRSRGKYTYNWSIEPDCRNVKVLKLILLPIVENCFFHAFKDYSENCIIDISVSQKDDLVVITVSDNGCGMTEEKIRSIYEKFGSPNLDLTGKGIGICNVYKRLVLCYGDKADIKIESVPGRGSRFTIIFPALVN